MKPMEKRNLAVIALARAYEQKDEKTIARVETILLPDTVKLPTELEEVLNSWGTSPIEESDMYALIKSAGIEDVKEIAVRTVDIDAFSALDISTLTHKVIQRISNHTDADGVFKTTPKLSAVKLPRTSQIKELKALIIGGGNAGRDRRGCLQASRTRPRRFNRVGARAFP